MSETVELLVAEIETLDLEGLRAFWRECYGAPPPLRSEPIMRQLLAWRVQAQAMGGLDEHTRKALARTGPVRRSAAARCFTCYATGSTLVDHAQG